jgi:electron transfer flavoprotein alpha/beta subunit
METNWLAYALAKGADLAIDVNDEQYVFVFRK